MAITTGICTVYKQAALATTMLSTDVYKLALYTSAATLGAATTGYSATDEVPASGSYSAGGVTLTGFTTGTSGTTGYLDWNDVVITSATITARGCLIYNATAGVAVGCYDFGAEKTSTAGTFTVTMPAPGAAAVVTAS